MTETQVPHPHYSSTFRWSSQNLISILFFSNRSSRLYTCTSLCSSLYAAHLIEAKHENKLWKKLCYNTSTPTTQRIYYKAIIIDNYMKLFASFFISLRKQCNRLLWHLLYWYDYCIVNVLTAGISLKAKLSNQKILELHQSPFH